ncbi:MAG: hypothetical protein ACXAD7_07310 [Candidatus Kariarchaeaceae archaeon]|jgi:hypothetical protein
MLIGLLHAKNINYSSRVKELLNTISVRARYKKSPFLIISASDSFDHWRNQIKRIYEYDDITGVIIFDEYVPTAHVYRSGYYPDSGISDNLMGNLTKQFKDKNKNGKFEIADMPEEYTQDVWVSRLVPYSISYNGVGWFRWFMNQRFSIWGLGNSRSYNYMLDYWEKKLERSTVRPTSSFIATCDWSKIAKEDSDNPMGFHLNMEKLQTTGTFGRVIGQYHLEHSDPEHEEGIQHMWHAPALGTAWHSAHSASSALGDFRYDEAYLRMKFNRGPTLLLLLACSVGEWQTNPCYNIVSNIYNSKENNNIKAIIGSGLMQWGGGFQVSLDPEGNWSGGENLFSLMKKYKGTCLGLAHKEWLEHAYVHYKSSEKYDYHKRMQLLIQYLCMNITGDGTLTL